MIRRLNRIETWIRSTLDSVCRDRLVEQSGVSVSVFVGTFVGFIVFVAATLGAAAVLIVPSAGAAFDAIASALAVIFAFALVFASPGDGALAVVSAVAVVLAFFGDLPAVTLVTLVVFFVALPIANAALDCVSWIITRWLLRRPADGAPGTRLVLGISFRLFFDLAFAFASLCLLAIVLPNTIEAANRFFAAFAWPTIDWLQLLNLAVNTSFSEGLFVTGILS